MEDDRQPQSAALTDQDLILFSKYWYQKQPNYKNAHAQRGALMAMIDRENHNVRVIFSDYVHAVAWFHDLDYPPGWQKALALMSTYDPRTEYVVVFHLLRIADDGEFVQLVCDKISNEPLGAES